MLHDATNAQLELFRRIQPDLQACVSSGSTRSMSSGTPGDTSASSTMEGANSYSACTAISATLKPCRSTCSTVSMECARGASRRANVERHDAQNALKVAPAWREHRRPVTSRVPPKTGDGTTLTPDMTGAKIGRSTTGGGSTTTETRGCVQIGGPGGWRKKWPSHKKKRVLTPYSEHRQPWRSSAISPRSYRAW